MQREFQFSTGEYYHIYNRGVDKRPIFRDRSDWDRLQQLLYLSNSDRSLIYRNLKDEPFSWQRGELLADVLAYTLMPNHVHVIAREHKSGGLSKFLSKTFTAYSMYFNIKYERSGALMCRPFRAKHIGSDEYFRWVLSYVHLNPVPSSCVDARSAELLLKNYWHSSYMDYFGTVRAEGRILSKQRLPIPLCDVESARKIFPAMASYKGDPLAENWG